MIAPDFHVVLSGDSVAGGPISIQHALLREPVLDAITRAYEGAHGAPALGRFDIGLVRWVPTDGSEETLFVHLDIRVTTERFLEAFGPLVTDQVASVEVTVDGIGGDSYVAELIGETSKLYRVAKGIFSIADDVRYQEHRREISRWQDSDEVTMRLRQLVLAESAWDPAMFSRQFKIDGRERGELLRLLGYEVQTRGGRKLWVELDPQ
jgi:hypothetical protein